MKSFLEDKILEFANANLETVAPSISIRATYGGKSIVDLDLGKSYKYYDLASLTKILFTTFACMQAEEREKDFLKTPLSFYRNDFKAAQITPSLLLSHISGFSAWAPFFRRLKRKTPKGMKSLLSGPLQHETQWELLQKKLKKIESEISQVNSKNPQTISAKKIKRKSIYSDIDFLFLGTFLEGFFKDPLLEIWEAQNKKLKLTDLHFCPGNQPKHSRSLYAPTEKSKWRKKHLRGEVHDDNAWALGGVAPHAGLFGSIDNLHEILLRMRAIYRGKKDPIAKTATLKKFTQRQIPVRQGDWSYGFMLPTKGKSSCGQHFSPNSFGHTGYTGTSFWYDPRKDLLVTILSNRVNPVRRNKRFVALRPLIHDWIAGQIR